MGDRERLAAVEAENIDLKARLAAIEGKLAPKLPPAQPIDEGVTITEIPLSLADSPTDAEFKALLDIVVRTVFPKLVPDREYLESFAAAFKFVATVGRLPGVELGKSRAEVWVAAANRQTNWRPEIQSSHLVAACAAAGDVSFTLGRWPFDVYCGLGWRSSEGIVGARPSAWREVLSSGKTRPQITTGRALYDTPPVRIQQLLVRG